MDTTHTHVLSLSGLYCKIFFFLFFTIKLLWADPISAQDYKKVSELLNKNNDNSFLPNNKRSTGFFFGEIATANFLTKNNLSYVIRAHELVAQGYKFDHNDTVITIFSSSHYCGGTNEAAIVMVETSGTEGFIKIIIPET